MVARVALGETMNLLCPFTISSTRVRECPCVCVCPLSMYIFTCTFVQGVRERV